MKPPATKKRPTKDMTFNLRLDESDRARLDALAEHYSASAATAVRILIKEKYDALTRAAAFTDAPAVSKKRKR